MTSEPLLPPRVVRMGEALRPLLSKLKERTGAPAVGEAAEPVTMEFLSHRLGAANRALARLEAAIKAMMTDVIAKEGADDTDVYRAVARLESRIDDLIDDGADLRCRAEGEFLEGARLLGNVYDCFLGRIEDWLEDLVESIADPLAAAERKGLPTSGDIKLSCKLNMDAPQQFAELQDWVDRELRERDAGIALAGTETTVPPVDRELTDRLEDLRLRDEADAVFWSTALAVGAGVLIGGLLFDD